MVTGQAGAIHHTPLHLYQCLIFRSSVKLQSRLWADCRGRRLLFFLQLLPSIGGQGHFEILWDILGHSDSESLWLQCFWFAQMKWEGHQTAATCSKQRLFFFRSPASAQHWSGGQGHFSHLCLYSVCGSLKSENSWVNSGPTQMRKLFCSIILIGSQTAASHWRLWEKN